MAAKPQAAPPAEQPNAASKPKFKAALPSVADLIRNPKAAEKLTIPQLNAFLAETKALLAMARAKKDMASDPADFAARVSQGLFKTPTHIKYLSAQYSEAIDGGGNNKCVSMPFQTGKSEFTSKWLPFWFLARYPRKRVILTSYEADFAEGWGRRVRNLVQTHGSEYGLKLDDSSKSASRWELVTGGGMQTAGAGGAIIGKGADLIIIDDPVKGAKEVRSKQYREDQWEWFTNTVLSRLQPGGRIIVVGTRWHQDDIIGRLNARTHDLPGHVRFDYIRLPAIAEEDDPLGRQPGAALWPSRYDEAYYNSLRITVGPYAFSAGYQQNPTPEEGNAVKRAWWRFYDSLPAQFDVLVQTWDLALTTEKDSDYTVGFLLGRKGTDIYVIDRCMGKWDPPTAIKEIRTFSQRYPLAVGKVIERSTASLTTIAMLQREILGVIPMPTKGLPKDLRLANVIPLIAAGNVWLPKSAQWAVELVEEAAQFPNVEHDDQVDALSQGLNYLIFGSYRAASDAQAALLEPTPPRTPEELMQREVSLYFGKILKAEEQRINYGRRPDQDLRHNYPLDYIPGVDLN